VVAAGVAAVALAVPEGRSDVSLVREAALAAQQAKPVPGQAPPQFRAAANLVRVDVYATTSRGPVLDLGQNDFEVYEDGVLQKVDSFEHIVFRKPAPEFERSEPRSDLEAQDAVADPRTRLFVVVFDTLHTFGYKGASQAPGSYDPRVVGRDLTTFLLRSIGADDLVALMRPDMSLSSLRFTRRPSRFEEYLLSGAEWQQRWLEELADDVERMYEACYANEQGIVGEMVARRREMRLLDTLRGLSVWLGALREGRKAVFVVSEGWELFRENQALARPLHGRVPSPLGIGSPPVRLHPAREASGSGLYETCERDRMMLARLDNARDYQRMLDEANRNGVTFYPIDIVGLRVGGTMNRRGDSLITLATATDGVAVINSNAFTPALERISQDLASYYLLGYYASNTKADGTFRKIDVKVKRAGVNVRARRGYLALTAAEGAALSNPPAAKLDPDIEARERALRQLDAESPRQWVRIAAGDGRLVGEPGGSPPSPVVWVAGELDAEAARQPEWSDGQSLAITVLDAQGTTVASGRATVSSSARSFSVWLNEHPLPAAGEFVVRVRRDARSEGVPETPVTARVKVPADPSGLIGSPLVFRAPAARAPFVATVQPRFRRTERLRVVLPVGAGVEAVSAQLLDRRGQALPVPLSFAIGADGPVRAAVGELQLAPLSVGDYVVQCEASAGPARVRTLVAFRIVP
jgi:VWFA-related protein